MGCICGRGIVKYRNRNTKQTEKRGDGMETIMWLVLFVVLLLVEIATLALTTIWFAGGAILAFLAAYAGFGLPVQIVVFLVSSIVLLVSTRPIVKNVFNQKRERTNAEALIGQRAVVLDAIDSLQNFGRVLVNGQEWAAKTEGTEILKEDTVVLIRGIQGVKLIVEKEED